MKNRRLNLDKLNIQSFITKLDGNDNVHGGQTFMGCGPTQIYPPCDPQDTVECNPFAVRGHEVSARVNPTQ